MHYMSDRIASLLYSEYKVPFAAVPTDTWVDSKNWKLVSTGSAVLWSEHESFLSEHLAFK